MAFLNPKQLAYLDMPETRALWEKKPRPRIVIHSIDVSALQAQISRKADIKINRNSVSVSFRINTEFPQPRDDQEVKENIRNSHDWPTSIKLNKKSYRVSFKVFSDEIANFVEYVNRWLGGSK